jgi:hypothetical protein
LIKQAEFILTELAGVKNLRLLPQYVKLYAAPTKPDLSGKRQHSDIIVLQIMSALNLCVSCLPFFEDFSEEALKLKRKSH